MKRKRNYFSFSVWMFNRSRFYKGDAIFFFFNNDLTSEIKNWEIYKVGDIKFRREIIATDRKWFIRKN